MRDLLPRKRFNGAHAEFVFESATAYGALGYLRRSANSFDRARPEVETRPRKPASARTKLSLSGQPGVTGGILFFN